MDSKPTTTDDESIVIITLFRRLQNEREYCVCQVVKYTANIVCCQGCANTYIGKRLCSRQSSVILFDNLGFNKTMINTECLQVINILPDNGADLSYFLILREIMETVHQIVERRVISV